MCMKNKNIEAKFPGSYIKKECIRHQMEYIDRMGVT